MSETDTVVVTGAGGFIGGRVVECAAESDELEPIAGVHRYDNAARIARFPVDIRELDVLDEESVRNAMADANYVVHCALGDREVTVEGTRNVLNVAEELGVERVVHLSTVEVYGDEDGVFDEGSSVQFTNRDYADSKVAAERVCRQYMDAGVSITVLRPGIVYGPFGETWTINPVRRLRSAHWGDVEGLDGLCNPVYVDDVVQAIRLAMKKDAARNEAYNVTSGETVSWNEYYKALNDALDGSPLAPRSYWRLYLWTAMVRPLRDVGTYAMDQHEEGVKAVTDGSHLVERFTKYVRKQITEAPTLSEMELYRRKAKYPNAKITDQLGYAPRFDLNNGQRLSAEWIAHHGFATR